MTFDFRESTIGVTLAAWNMESIDLWFIRTCNSLNSIQGISEQFLLQVLLALMLR